MLASRAGRERDGASIRKWPNLIYIRQIYFGKKIEHIFVTYS
jgi:hypothetical protein